MSAIRSLSGVMRTSASGCLSLCFACCGNCGNVFKRGITAFAHNLTYRCPQFPQFPQCCSAELDSRTTGAMVALLPGRFCLRLPATIRP